MACSRSSRGRPTPLYLLLLLLVAGGLSLYYTGALSWLGLSPGPQVITVTPGAWVQVNFTTPDATGTTAQQEGLDTLLVADIAVAQQRVDLASFDFDLDSVTRALIEAHQRGVQVRMVIDSQNLEDEEVKRLTDELTLAGIPIAYDDRAALMHDKFVIIDQHIVWVGSWNLTVNGTYHNNNNALRLAIPELAANYTVEFEEMFVEGAFGPRSPANTPHSDLQLSDGSRIETYFSPEDNPLERILDRLGQAQDEIVFMAFSFTDDEIARVLLEKAREGVRVRGVFESRGASGQGSEYPVLRDAGLDVLLDGNPRTMHHKVLIIDGFVTITGSYNFTASAAEDNDENVLIIENANLAQSYLEEFERVYRVGQKE